MIYLLLVKEKCYWNTKWIEELHVRDLYVNNAPTQQKFALQWLLLVYEFCEGDLLEYKMDWRTACEGPVRQ
jgi:hypothetical protein